MTLPFNDRRDPKRTFKPFPGDEEKLPSFSIRGKKHLLVPPVLTPAARSPPLHTAAGCGGDAFVHREGETEAGRLDGPERGDQLQPTSSPSPQPGLTRVRGIYKSDKGAERIFQTPKLRNLSSPSTDIICNYRVGGGVLCGGGWRGARQPVSPQRASPSSPSLRRVPRDRHQPVPPPWPP